MKRRVGLLMAALIVALFGTTAVYAYVNRVEAKTVNANAPVDVIVAAAQIPAGTTGAVVGQSGLAVVQSVPQRNVPPGALTNLGSVDKKQLAADVYPGEVLIAAKFTDANQARTGALAIPDDKLAVSVQLDDPQRVAGFVVPGSQVAVFYTPDNQDGDTSQTGVILPRSLVIAVGPSTLQANGATGAGTQPAATAILTLALTQRQAQMLVLAQQTGTLYLGLLSDKSDVKVGAPTTTAKLYH
jgi:pilus assembly protein CpaB